MKEVKKFKDLGIQVDNSAFEGDKISIERVLNREITVHDFKIVKTKFPEKGNPECLHLQISIGENKHVVFSGSKVLQDSIRQISKSDFPFITIIVKGNRRFEFT
jgi:hypothetical protein